MRSMSKSSKLRLPLLCLILSGLSGCATGLTDPVPTNGYCAIARPIGYSSIADSAETVAAIEAHNSKWVCVCEKDCPNATEKR